MKSQDVVVLFKLISLRQRENYPRSRRALEHYNASEQYSVRSLADALGISKSEISNSINRSLYSGIASKSWEDQRLKVNEKALLDFIVYGLKYVFPIKPGPLARGIATSFAAPVLENQIMSAGESVFVWPHADGRQSGQSIEPLIKSAPMAVEKDPWLYAVLAVTDAIRLGSARETKVARHELEMRLLGNA